METDVKRFLLFVFCWLGFFQSSIGTPDIVIDVLSVTYETVEGKFLIEADEERNLIKLCYEFNQNLSCLPKEVTSKISGVDLYSLLFTNSLGIVSYKPEPLDEIYVYLRFENFVEVNSTKKANLDEYELSVTFSSNEYKSAEISHRSKNLPIDVFYDRKLKSNLSN